MIVSDQVTVTSLRSFTSVRYIILVFGLRWGYNARTADSSYYHKKLVEYGCYELASPVSVTRVWLSRSIIPVSLNRSGSFDWLVL
jgi:hypothetical protein